MTKFLKGDATAAITLALADGFDYSGKTVHLEYQGARRSFSGVAAGGSLTFSFTAAETAPMSLGAYPVRVWMEDENGGITTIKNADVKLCVTDSAADVHSDGAIYLDVRGGLYGIEGLPERYTDEDLRRKIHEILRRLGGTVAAFALAILPAFGATVDVQTAPKGTIYNDEQVVTNVVLDVSDLVTTGQLATAVGAIPAPDFTVSNDTLVATIEATAPAPGDYATVSNRAMNSLGVGKKITYHGDTLTVVTNDLHFNNVPNTHNYAWINCEDDTQPDLFLYSEGDILIRSKLVLTEWKDFCIEGDEAYPNTSQTLPGYIQGSLSEYATTNGVRNIVTNEAQVGWSDWVFSGTSAGDGYHWECLWEPANISFILYKVSNADPSNITPVYYAGHSPDEDDILHFSAMGTSIGNVDVTATRQRIMRNSLGLARLSDLPPLTNGLASTTALSDVRSVAEAAVSTNTVQFSLLAELADEIALLSANVQSCAQSATAASAAASTNAANISTVRSIVNLWEGYWDGTNVIFEVTNYYGNTSGELPRLRIKELREGAWHTVWDEANKFAVCETQIVAIVAASNAACRAGCAADLATGLAGRAPLAWGTVTDKGSPNVVSNSVWMTAPETYFAGGTEYQRVAVGSGTICVLVDNGAGTYTAGEEGTFRFQDEGGTNYFGFAKSDSYTIGCRTDGITVSGTLVTLRYDVIMGGTDVPIVYYRQSLTSGEWVQLNNADGTATQGAPYTVTWYTSGGSYYAAINCGSNSSGFFKAETSVAGDVVFETNMKARLDGGIECPNTATGVMGVTRPTFNGSTVIWNWSAR